MTIINYGEFVLQFLGETIHTKPDRQAITAAYTRSIYFAIERN